MISLPPLPIFLLSILLVTASAIKPVPICSADYGNYTSNSTYRTNLIQLFSALAANGPATGFNTTTVGQGPDQVYGLVLCRGDVSAGDCRKCISDAGTEITKQCSVMKEGTIWLDYCFLRYSNISFFGDRDDEINYFWDTDNKADPIRFGGLAESLLTNLSSQATSGGSRHRFATGDTSFNNSIKIYGVAQCTMDLTISDCKTCLAKASSELPTCCSKQWGAVIMSRTCYTRYDKYQFYFASTASPPLNPSSPSAGRPPMLSPKRPSTSASRSGNKSITVIIISIVVALLSVIFCGLFIWKAKASKRKAKKETGSTNLEIFSLQTIKVATNDFSEENKLGEGGFGPVYKGTLEDGQQIAIKRLSRLAAQGTTEFKNEVQLVAKLQHKNLVRLLGCCLEGEERILVYEYVPNSSLDKFIFGLSKRAEFTWEQLYKIIIGVARGLVYLHEDFRLTVIHRDVKASNILLDENLNPKIADFGLARLLSIDQTHQDTTKIMGTYGYMSPEYAMHGKFSVKSDVYSFGVLLLEILSGKRNMAFQELGDQDLLSYAWRLWSEGRPLQLIDPAELESCPRAEVLRCIHIGLLCVQQDPDDRPTMASVILMLNNTSVTLQKPLTPAFFLDKSSSSDQTFESKESKANEIDMLSTI